MKNRILAGLTVICLVLIACFWPGKDENIAKDADKKEAQAITQAETESLARNIILYDQAGKAHKIKDLYNKKPVYLLVWMPWSELSEQQLPVLETLYHQYGQRVYFVILSLGRDDTDVQSFLASHDYDLPFYTTDIENAAAYTISEVPESIMIGQYGQIRERRQGCINQKELSYMIEKGQQGQN
ncbi:MAG: TlpA family protein disulfide reductase [Megasphaera sp.]|jgi:hypothetical protein|nr:TlpA family protein disulfide reductase [Megasphaera sp.]MCH4187457.1 TlpA family protein disulfide reductase [Megasphaera sp.]MCH4217376.1 TlpA family protein disulfide reductase [Megasphaera sp.]